MKRTARFIVLILVAAVALLYVGDFLSFHFRFPGNRVVVDTVQVQPLLAVPHKDGKTEFILDDPVDEQCANSLFPHGGLPPCWYLKRHARKQVNL